MVRSLLRLFVTCSLVLIAAAPLHAQYIFMDTNKDGVCNAADFPSFGTPDSVEVWIDTSKNQDGSPATCGTGEALTMASYELLLRTDATTATLAWTNGRPEFTVEDHRTFQAGAAWVGNSSPGLVTHLAPGKYLLGRATYQHTGGCPFEMIIVPQIQSLPEAKTGFFSQCLGSQADNFVRFGSDFDNACSVIVICDDVKSTTWGEIKHRYR